MSDEKMDEGDGRVRLPPGVYRGCYSAPPPASSPANLSHASSAATQRDGAAFAVTDTRRRFHQLRDLRRELSGRLLPSTEAAAVAGVSSGCTPLASSSTSAAAGAAPAHVSGVLPGAPSVASFGLPLDRLVADDPVTRSVLRTAAAERALRQQQAENDVLKRSILAQRQEAAQMQSLIDRLSSELAETGRTVLRQTATMKSLSSEMERRDAYHLIKERRSSQAAGESASPSGAGQPPASSTSEVEQRLTQRVEQLQREKAELEQRLSDGAAAHRPRPRSGRNTVEAIDRDDSDGDDLGVDGWEPRTLGELQQLVRACGDLLRGAASSEAVYELELSSVTFLASQRGVEHGRLGGHHASACAATEVRVSGPYNIQDVLVRVHAAARPAVPDSRHATVLGQPHSTSYARCAFYALSHTRGAVHFGLYERTDAMDGDAGMRSAVAPATPAASAAVAVQTLIAAALAGGRELSAGLGAASMHTVHLVSPSGVVHGAITFRVTVANVQQRYRRYRSHGGVPGGSSRTPDVHRRRCRSPAVSVDSGRVVSDGLCLTPPRGADMRCGGASGAATPVPQSHHSPHRGPMLSPCREEEDGPVAVAAVAVRQPRLSSRSSQSTPPAPSSVLSGGAAVVVGVHGGSGDVAARRASDPDAALTPPPPLVGGTVSGGTPARTAAAESGGCAGGDVIRDLHDSAAAETETTAGALVAVVPPPPHVAVPPPPRPPAANVEVPPAKVPRSPVPSTALMPAAQHMRVHVLELRDGGAPRAEDSVEGMLDRAALRVMVVVGGACVFVSPTRRTPSHAVWGADEGTFSISVTAAHDIRFDVCDGDTRLSQAAWIPTVVRGASGRSTLTLLACSDGSPCGQLALQWAVEDPTPTHPA
ncbi:hypothetical protein NESM_000235400 [Novymonas esmeraldas]|uniref:Uncharacterized protein n=1 Tax=Novymonas esmeraldas TaxID=1808958 RepID=A0AAW0FBR3_9TRYP